jgi:hypothetical protein
VAEACDRAKPLYKGNLAGVIFNNPIFLKIEVMMLPNYYN